MHHESLLMLIFTGLVFLTVGISLFPLRHSKRLCWVVLTILLVCLPVFYLTSGGWREWSMFCQKERDEQRAKHFLAEVRGSEGVIKSLKQRLKHNPKSAQGWYLLGRLYGSQGEWRQASNAFKHAYTLKPNDAFIAINYAQSLWQVSGLKAHTTVHEILKRVLEKNPKQPDAIALMAQHAFESGQYSTAINYWQTLLSLLPGNSEEANLIRRAIAQAHQKSTV